MMNHFSGVNEAGAGKGRIRAGSNDRGRWCEYDYKRADDGSFLATVSTWTEIPDGAGLVAYMSRGLPDRASAMRWIFSKVELLVED